MGDRDELHAGDAGLCGGGQERLEAEGETALARLIMDGGDLEHAADHLGNAFATDPRLPEAHEALAELAARAGGPHEALRFFPLEKPFIGAVVCRAHLQAACGAWADAVGLIAGAVRAEPERPWSHVAWLTQDALPDLLPPQAMTQALARAVGAAWPGVGAARCPTRCPRRPARRCAPSTSWPARSSNATRPTPCWPPSAPAWPAGSATPTGPSPGPSRPAASSPATSPA